MIRTIALALGFALSLTGPADVKDGDSITVDGQEVRLHGIDAPEWSQPCGGGKLAAAWVRKYTQGAPVTCTPRYRDRYGRYVSTCYVDGHNLNEAVVRAGWAFAYRRYSWQYIAAENAARTEGRGMWALNCQKPWAYRRQRLDK